MAAFTAIAVRPFFIGFGKNLLSRKSCYSCHFRHPRSQADLTLADFWGAERLKGIDTLDNKGVSLVIANTPKGQATLDSIREKCYLMETSFREAALGNPRVTESAPMPRSRALFFDDLIRGMRFSSLRRKYMNPFVQTLKLSAKDCWSILSRDLKAQEGIINWGPDDFQGGKV